MSSNSVIESGFVLPHVQEKLGGELGLTLHEIAKSLKVKVSHAKQKLEKMIRDKITDVQNQIQGLFSQ